MSTLATNTIRNLAGTASTSADNVIRGSAKAWVNFNGSTPPVIRASYNVSSVTRASTGNFTITFTNTFADADYALTGAIKTNATTSTGSVMVHPSATPAADSVQIYISNCAAASQAAFDAVYAYVAIFR